MEAEILEEARWSKEVVVRTIVGSGQQGHRDGPSGSAFDCPVGISLSRTSGSYFVCETGNHVIRRVRGALEPTVVVETVAGLVGGGCVDGSCRTARFLFPSGLDYCYSEPYEELLVADTGNGSLRLVDLVEGVVSSPVDRGRVNGRASTIGAPKDCVFAGSRTEAFFTDNARIYHVDLGGSCPAVRVVAGGGGSRRDFGSVFAQPAVEGYRDGSGSKALFNQPDGIAYDAENDTLYVCDTHNHRIRAVVGGKVSTLAGGSAPGFRDGFFSDALFKFPQKIAFDAEGGRLFVTDLNDCLRVLYLGDGLVSTLAGSGLTGHQDGYGSSARLDYPCGVSYAMGMVMLCDSNNHSLRGVHLSVPGIIGGPLVDDCGDRRTGRNDRMVSLPSSTAMVSLGERGGTGKDGVGGGRIDESVLASTSTSLTLRRMVMSMVETSDALLRDVNLDILRRRYFLEHTPEVLLAVMKVMALIIDIPSPGTAEDCSVILLRPDLKERMGRARVGQLSRKDLGKVKSHLERLHRTRMHKLPELQRLIRWLEAFHQANQYLADHTQRLDRRGPGGAAGVGASHTAGATSNGLSWEERLAEREERERTRSGRGRGRGGRGASSTSLATSNGPNGASGPSSPGGRRQRCLEEAVGHLKNRSQELIAVLGTAFEQNNNPIAFSLWSPRELDGGGGDAGAPVATNRSMGRRGGGTQERRFDIVEGLVARFIGYPLSVDLSTLHPAFTAAAAGDGRDDNAEWSGLHSDDRMHLLDQHASERPEGSRVGKAETLDPLLLALESGKACRGCCVVWLSASYVCMGCVLSGVE